MKRIKIIKGIFIKPGEYDLYESYDELSKQLSEYLGEHTNNNIKRCEYEPGFIGYVITNNKAVWVSANKDKYEIMNTPKSLLKTGHYIVTKEGQRRLVLLNTGNVRNNNTTCRINSDNYERATDYFSLDNWNDNLECIAADGCMRELDAVQILDMYGVIIWKREENKLEITATVNGKSIPLSNISEKTLINLRKNSNK